MKKYSWLLNPSELLHFYFESRKLHSLCSGLKPVMTRDARLFAFTLYFSLADSVGLQHFTNTVHRYALPPFCGSTNQRLRFPRSVSHTWVSSSQSDAQSFSPQYSLINLINSHPAIQTPWL